VVGAQAVEVVLDPDEPVELARKQDEMVVPLCPLVEGYIERHEEFASLLDGEMFSEMRS
jgi:hypothetical protein